MPVLLDFLDEAFDQKSWHGPNLWSSIRGVTAREAAWRVGPGRHNIWELTLHAAYWKYVVRRKIDGAKRGSFVLKGSNFFPRPEKGNATEAAWRADLDILANEHDALIASIRKLLKPGADAKRLRMIYGV